MADYPTVEDPFDVSHRERCAVCGREMYRDESRAVDAPICSDYCLGRHDERCGVPISQR